MTAERNSKFELLRLFSMFTIVLYHLYMGQVYPLTQQSVNLAIQIPLHIGVPIFVMISGYWGIRPSVRGLCRLVSIVGFYTIGLLVAEKVLLEDGGG